MDDLLGNLVAWSAQSALVAAGGTLLLWLLRVDAPLVRYASWRALLALCLLLPWIQGREPRTLEAGAALAPATEVAILDAGVLPAQAVTAAWTPDWIAVAAAVLLAGALARLTWIAVSLVRLRRLRRTGVVAGPHAEDQELQQILGTHAELREVPGLRQPVTFGSRLPVVLLPESVRAQEPAIRRAVVCHELLHVQRRDWNWVLVEELVRAAAWFNPAVWWIVSRIQLAREEVVDEMAVAITGSRRRYIEALLAFADGAPLATAPALLRTRHLFRRILLISKEAAMPPRRVAVSCLVMMGAAAAGSWCAVQAFPMTGQPAPRDLTAVADVTPASSPWRDASVATTPQPLSPTAAAAPAVATVGNAVARPEPTIEPQPGTGENSRISEVNAAPESTSPAAAPSAAAQTRNPSSPVSGRAGQVSPPPTPPAPREPIRVGGNITPPKKIVDVKPVYPAEAQAKGVQGIVIVEAVIDEHGKVTSARAIRSIPLLDQAALDAVRQWQYTPTHLNGNPIAIVMSVTVNFTLAPTVNQLTGPADTPIPLRIGGTFTAPAKTKHVPPVYPPVALAAQVSGAVVVEMTVDTRGRVTDAHVVRSVPMLDQAALDTVRQWEFAPTSFNGTLVPVVMSATVNFIMPPEARGSAQLVDGVAPLRVGGNIGAPRRIRNVAPVYPPEAIAARVSGIVILEITIDAQGRVVATRVIRSIPLLDQAAIDAVRQWVYEPTLLNGQPVPILMSVTVNFTGPA